MKILSGILWLTFCAGAFAQESNLGADFRGEGERFKTGCSGFSFSMIASCAQVLFTDHPLHIAVGSLAPGNGIGVGAALVGHWTTQNWRNSYDIDAVGTKNGSWRGGGYVTLVRSNVPVVKVGKGRPAPGTGSSPDASQEQLVVHLYAENDSLNKIAYFGIGPSTSDTSRTYFGMRETITGANVVWPVFKRFNVSILGEANGRFVDTRGAHGEPSPSIEQVFTPATAPGLFNETAFAQFGEGVRLRPSFAAGHVQLNYLVNYQQYVAGDSHYSFQRFTTDVSHEFPLYKNYRPRVKSDFNGPDDCSASSSDDDHKCLPATGITRNLEGSISVRFLLSESIIPSGNTEPFYFQPTLGGSDINGNPMLPSYQDYRYRAPNLMLFRAKFEHSIYKLPIGVVLMLDEGKVANRRSDIDFNHLQHSYSAGLTFRAGGFPVLQLLFSWGGHEGTHTTGSIDTSLLGGGGRPSLF